VEDGYNYRPDYWTRNMRSTLIILSRIGRSGAFAGRFFTRFEKKGLVKMVGLK